MGVLELPMKRLARITLALGGGVLLLVAPVALYDELAHSSALQAHYFTRIARDASYQLESGPSPSLRFPIHGPFDERLGYVHLPAFLKRLQTQGCSIAQQARWSEQLTTIADWGLFPPYREATQTGMRVLDRNSTPLLDRRYPERTYNRFEDIPQVVVDTLLFIENRQLLVDEHPQRNPALELDRLVRAVLDRGIQSFNKDHRTPGGSTLATQIEKFRHSRDGRTDSIGEKLRQMVSASLRVYRDGEDTRERRKGIILDFLNSVPLGGRSPWGEVHGLGDALWVYFGQDLTETSRMLATPDDDESLAAKAAAFKAVLGLLLAQRRPSTLLGVTNGLLPALITRHLHLLADAGLISERLRDATLAAPLHFRPNQGVDPALDFSLRKGTDSVRAHLADWLGVPRRYDLDRLDVTVATTLDAAAQREISTALRRLSDPAAAKAAGLVGERMLAQGDPAQVVYSVTLYELSENAFRLLVQADNLDRPFDVNEGLKLDLGSTAKLRTLVTYLELIAELHARLGALDTQALRDWPAEAEDILTRWALSYLLQAPDRSLQAMLEAALERRYTADPGEQYFTGGGMHSFQNFRREDDAKVLSVREAFRDSINLVFIRLMRDMVRHYTHRDGEGRVLRDRTDPRRAEYLARFADYEGREFLRRFLNEHRALDTGARIASLADRRQPTPARLASIFRTIAPADYEEAYRVFFATRSEGNAPLPSPTALPFDRYALDRSTLADRAYVAGLHPLELWLVAYLNQYPAATFAEIVSASSTVRQEAYQWLFKGRSVQAQDRAIRTILEVDAFARLHRAWKRVGYPFESLVPSYATAVGASADRPAALALLMGTILADGVRLPVARTTGLRFAANTPYETNLKCQPNGAERVLAPEVAAAVRKALVEVAERGTAVHAKGFLQGSIDPAFAVGGKTGTGDHRLKTFAADGTLRESKAVNRAGTFVFFAGNRLFGVVTAYVPGIEAEQYRFTSSLPVRVLKHLEPMVRGLVAPLSDLELGP